VKALVVDDDRVLADVVAFTLRREGFQVIQAHDGEAALQRWAHEQPDLIILDVNLPKLDGFAVCERIRAQSDTPIVLLTVRGEEDDIVQGLRFGADDYISKPFSPRQLVARARAVLRRAGRGTLPDRRQVGSVVLDTSRRELHIGQGEVVSLTPLESRLLDYLLLNAGHVLTTDAIISHVWGSEGGERDMLRQLVRRLRGKVASASQSGVGASSTHPQAYIETVSGLGYGFVVPTPEAMASSEPAVTGSQEAD
jgi:DNA-binding response OmpR family regulator